MAKKNIPLMFYLVCFLHLYYCQKHSIFYIKNAGLQRFFTLKKAIKLPLVDKIMPFI